MKRNPSLVSLSKEHHPALMLSRLLQKDAPFYKSLPSDTGGKASYAIQFYNDNLIPHFKNEEKIFSIVVDASDNIHSLVSEVIQEHHELHNMFREMKEAPDLINHLDRLGKQLELHIRKEERVLFPMIEDSCTENMLTEIGEYLSLH